MDERRVARSGEVSSLFEWEEEDEGAPRLMFALSRSAGKVAEWGSEEKAVKSRREEKSIV